MIRLQRRSADGETISAATLVMPWPTEDAALDHLLAAFRASLRADGLAIVTGGRHELPVRAVCSASAAPSPDDALLAWLVRLSRPVIVANVEATAPPVRSRWLEEEGARSLVAIPFRVDGAVTGAIVAFSQTPDCFAPSCLAVGELAAAVVVPALEALWRAHAAESMLDIAKMVVTRDNIKDLLKEACTRAVRLCDGARACVWVTDAHGRSVISFSANATGAPDPGMWARFRDVWPIGRALADDSVSRWILAERTPLVLDDYAESPFCDPAVLAAFGTHSLIALPLLHDDRVIGVMTVDRTEVRPFSAPEVRLALSLAETIAPLVERARRRDETEAELRRAEAQVEIARSLSSTLELEPLLKVVAQHAARACLLVEAQASADALRAKNVELDSFVSTVSHDLKSPLVTLHLLRDLLALAHVGRGARVREEIALDEVVAGVLAELAEPLRARGIAVAVAPLPRLTAVRVEIEQVMRNLLTNAVKYIGGGPSPVIVVGGLDRGAAIEGWVRDNGIGIDPAYHDRIFDLFERLREIDAEGTGVGLAIVKKIVDAAGGRVWVESARGMGSTFRFTWPKSDREGG